MVTKKDKICYAKRIYDDLCEDILQWLPIEDKIILIGVSKQFNRCLRNVWLRQQVLKLDLELKNDRNNLKLFMGQLSDIRLSEESKAKKFQKILLTFPNINQIVFGKNTKLYMIEDLLLGLVIKYSPQLEAITFSPFNCSTKLVEDFAEHFGPNLKRIEFLDKIYMIKILIEQSPNLQVIRFLNFKNLFNNNKEPMTKRVEKLKVFGVNDIEMLDTFVKNNAKLIHLEIGLSFANSQQTSEALAILSKLSELRILKISLLDCDQSDERIVENIETIAMNCNKLKCFGLEVDRRKTFDTELCFAKFEHFTSSLARLCLNSHDSSTPHPIPTQTLKSDHLKSLSNLTHLELMSDQIDDHFFIGIETKVPKLKYLMIGFVRKKITDECFASLVELQCLSTLIVKSLDREYIESLTDSGLLRLINGSHSLQTVAIFNKIKISETTVDAIIDKAIDNPLIYYNYYLRGIENRVDFVRYRLTNHKFGNRCLNNIFITGSGQVFAKSKIM